MEEGNHAGKIDAPDDIFGFTDYLVRHTTKESIKGQQYLFYFSNGYGASVIRGEYSYGGEQGLWELAVIKLRGGNAYTVVYDTPVTDDVIGYASVDKIKEALQQIKNLEAK